MLYNYENVLYNSHITLTERRNRLRYEVFITSVNHITFPKIL